MFYIFSQYTFIILKICFDKIKHVFLRESVSGQAIGGLISLTDLDSLDSPFIHRLFFNKDDILIHPGKKRNLNICKFIFI